MQYYLLMQRKHMKTLELIFKRPTSGNIKWTEIEALLIALGAKLTERQGSRVGRRVGSVEDPTVVK